MAKANKQRGQREIELNGETYVMEFDLNALVEYEELVEESGHKDTPLAQLPNKLWRRILWLALRENNEEFQDEQEGERRVGRLINMGDINDVVRVFAEVFSAGQQAQEGNGEARPAKREPAGTGAK